MAKAGGNRTGADGGCGAAPSPAKGAGGARELTIRRGAAGLAQVRKVRVDGWTAEKRTDFLKSLAETCNVVASAREAGMSARSAYDLRERDPAFAQKWEYALTVAYSELEMALLHAMKFGSEDVIEVQDAVGEVKQRTIRRGRDWHVAERLLRAHRSTAARIRAEQTREAYDGEEARAELDRMVQEVRVREGLPPD